jgi:NAD(P)-dependent dehydrogenase (short-subunit alcohol dehydrogenase family)
VVPQLRAAGPTDIIQLDTSDEASILRVAEDLKGEPIDLLINNAGIAVRDSLARVTKADLMRQYEVNAVGPFLVTRALHPSLKAAAAANGHATVANISGIVASIGTGSAFPGLYGYSASKVALNMFHAKLARDLKKDKIISLSFHPGILATDMTAGKGQVQPIAAAATVEKLISGATLQHSGKFLDYSGKELPW